MGVGGRESSFDGGGGMEGIHREFSSESFLHFFLGWVPGGVGGVGVGLQLLVKCFEVGS